MLGQPITDLATRDPTLVRTGVTPGPLALFLGFSRIGLSGFGGVLPWARRALVEREHWLSAEEFNVLLGLCQFLPGPNVLNLSVAFGVRCCGWRGGFSGALGLMLGPFLIALVLGLLYTHYGDLPVVQSMLHGITLVGAGLILATGIHMGLNIKQRRVYLPFAAVAFAGIVWWHWSFPVVMLVGAVLSVGLSWWRLTRGAST